MRRILILVAVALLGGGAVVAFLFLRGDPPPPVTLETTTTTGATESEAPETTTSTEGTWVIRAGDSFVGYRVQETLLRQELPNTAVGRTTAVEGSVAVSRSSVTEAEIVADLTELESDESRRDRALRTRGLETNEFPTASFHLTEPVDLGDAPARDQPISLTATGELTLHGVTRTVEFPLEAVWEGDLIRAVGSLEVVLADYDIDPPSVAGSISVEDTGIIEVQLVLERG